MCAVDHDPDLRANIQVLPNDGHFSSSSTITFVRLHVQQLWELSSTQDTAREHESTTYIKKKKTSDSFCHRRRRGLLEP